MLSLLLTPCLVFATVAYSDVPATDHAAEVVPRRYSLESVIPPTLSYPSGVDWLLIPLVVLDPAPNSDPATFDQRMHPESIVELIRRFVAPAEWELPDRALVLFDSGSLLVIAPPEVHSEVARFLGFLSSHFCRQARVRVETFIINDTTLPALPGDGNARAFLDGLLANRTLTAGCDVTVDLTSGTPKSVKHERERTYLRQHDHELAQSAAMSVPNLSHYSVGHCILLRADFGLDDRIAVRFAVNHTEELRPLRVTSTHSAALFTTQDRIQDLRDESVVESPQLGFSMLAGSVFLTPGRTQFAYIAPVASDEMDRQGLLVALTLESKSAAEAKFTSGRQTLTITDTAADLPTGLFIPTKPLESGVTFNLGGDSDDGLRLLEAARQALGSKAGDNAYMEYVGGFLMLSGEVSSAVSQSFGSMLACRNEGACVATLDVSHGSPSKLPFFSLPLANTASVACSGFAETYLSEMIADVAQSSVIANSQAASMITGRFVYLSHDPYQDAGKIDVKIEQRLRRGDPTEIDQKVEFNSRIDRVDFDSAGIAESLGAGQNRAAFPNVFLRLASVPQANGSTSTTATLTLERIGPR